MDVLTNDEDELRFDGPFSFRNLKTSREVAAISEIESPEITVQV